MEESSLAHVNAPNERENGLDREATVLIHQSTSDRIGQQQNISIIHNMSTKAELANDIGEHTRSNRITFSKDIMNAEEKQRNDADPPALGDDMSELTQETSYFPPTQLVPPSRKVQWACIIVILVVTFTSITVASICGSGECRVNSRTEKKDSSLDSNGTSAPTLAPTQSLEPENTRLPTKAFSTHEELLSAVDQYLETGRGPIEYGHPIGIWNVSQITDFSHVFSSLRNPLCNDFNENLTYWNTSQARTMQGLCNFLLPGTWLLSRGTLTSFPYTRNVSTSARFQWRCLKF
jgi:hypothetical protein